MRRWLAVLLLVFLPLQFSWAAVAGYCGHEAGAAANHVGHHDHADHGHAAPSASPDPHGPATQADGTAPGGFDLDCGHCHGHSAGLVNPVPPFAAPAQAHVPPQPGALRIARHLPAPPERPQWAGLA